MNKIHANTRNSDMAEVGKRISTAYTETGPQDDVGLKGLFGEINPKTKLLTISTEQMKAESNLVEKDDQRDDDFKALYYLVQGATYNPDATISKAAQKLFKYINQYGLDTTKESYDTQSNLTESLLIDLNKDELKDSIAQVAGCAKQIAILKASNEAFRASRSNYQEELSKDKDKVSATAVKRELLSLINDKLITYLNGMMIIKAESYENLVNRLSEIIDQNNEVVKKRSSKSNNEE